MRLELEYFERIEVNPRLILLRLGAQPAPENDVVLLVTADGAAHRAEPLAGSVAVEADGRWRAAFPIGRELMDTEGVTFALEAGETVDLPSPTDRVLADGHPPAGGNGTGAEAAVAAEEAAEEEEAAAEEEPAAAEATEEAPPAEAVAPPASGRRTSALLVWGTIALGLLAAVVVVVFVLAQNGSDSSTTATKPPPATRTAPQTLAALPGTDVKATAQIVPLGHDRFSLRIRGLKTGTYQAWAFNSIIDCTSLGTFRGPDARTTITLPANASRYHWLDVSREGDASPNHSGLSVLRVSISALR